MDDKNCTSSCVRGKSSGCNCEERRELSIVRAFWGREKRNVAHPQPYTSSPYNALFTKVIYIRSSSAGLGNSYKKKTRKSDESA